MFKYLTLFYFASFSLLFAQDRLYVVQSLDESLGQVVLGNGNVNSNVLSLGLYANDIVQCGNKLYVTNSGLNSVQEIDPVSNTTVRSIPLAGGVNPWSLAMVNNDTLAVTCSVSNNVILIRLSDGQTVGEIPAGLSPEGILAAGDRLYITLTRYVFPNFGSGVVMIYNRTTLQWEDSISVGTNPQFAAIDNQNRLHVVCTGDYSNISGQIRVVDLANLQTVSTLNVGGSPSTVSFGGDYAFVSAGGWGGSGYVYRYRLSDLQLLNDENNPLQTSQGVTDVEGMPDGSFYASCFAEDKIEYRSANGQLLDTYLMSDGPGYMLLYHAETSAEDPQAGLPQSLEIETAYPNPFNSSVSLKFSGVSLQNQRIFIYNALGQRIDEVVLGGGRSEVRWEARNSNGGALPSGIYFARLQGRENSAAQPLHFLK